jgi:predicted lipoprotein with Yx(FWY)xxD motif
MNRILLFLGIAAAAMVVAVPATSSREAAASGRATVQAGASRFGRILFDGRGFVLYGFTRDRRSRSLCSGECAQAWPPYIVDGRPSAGERVNGKLLATTRRADGKLQVTYAGKPLYYYVGDRKPAQILCQNVREFGGVWLVIRPSGRLVR